MKWIGWRAKSGAGFRSDIQLEHDLAADLWTIHAGPSQMRQVLVNLIVAIVLLGVDVGGIYVGGWGPGPVKTLGIQLICDGLSKLMAVIINLVALVSILYAQEYMRRFTSVREWIKEMDRVFPLTA